MKESGLSVTLSAEKGAIRKCDGKYEGSKKTQERVEAELKEKKEDEEWKKEKKEREDGWERQRLDHERRLRNTWEWVRGEEKAKKDAEKAKGRQEEEEEERDNIKETRYETTEEYGPLQPPSPRPATTSTVASLDVEGVPASEEEEEVRREEEEKKKAKSAKSKGKGTKGLPTRAPSYAQLLEANRALEKKLEKERRASKKRSSRKSGSDRSEKRRASESDSSTVKRYEDGLLASPLSKSHMDAE